MVVKRICDGVSRQVVRFLVTSAMSSLQQNLSLATSHNYFIARVVESLISSVHLLCSLPLFHIIPSLIPIIVGLSNLSSSTHPMCPKCASCCLAIDLFKDKLVCSPGCPGIRSIFLWNHRFLCLMVHYSHPRITIGTYSVRSSVLVLYGKWDERTEDERTETDQVR